jgi:hypothetical protein
VQWHDTDSGTDDQESRHHVIFGRTFPYLTSWHELEAINHVDAISALNDNKLEY